MGTPTFRIDFDLLRPGDPPPEETVEFPIRVASFTHFDPGGPSNAEFVKLYSALVLQDAGYMYLDSLFPGETVVSGGYTQLLPFGTPLTLDAVLRRPSALRGMRARAHCAPLLWTDLDASPQPHFRRVMKFITGISYEFLLKVDLIQHTENECRLSVTSGTDTYSMHTMEDCGWREKRREERELAAANADLLAHSLQLAFEAAAYEVRRWSLDRGDRQPHNDGWLGHEIGQRYGRARNEVG